MFYFAKDRQALIEYIREKFVLGERCYRSKGMANPHDAYVEGNNDAVEEIIELLTRTRIEDGWNLENKEQD